MSVTALQRRSAGTIHHDILLTASQLFYAHGIHAVSADRIIAAAGISKVTFYRHFASKDDLVVAYLRNLSARERMLTDAALDRFADRPHELVDWFARVVAAQSCRPGFRGCAFINAAGEYPDAASPVRQAVAEHRAWFRSVLVLVAARLGAERAEAVADQLVVLRDGLLVSGYLGERPSALASGFTSAVESVLTGRR
ncbi:TetR/AcrR family transcriptional regulator [soil metagenome]